MELTTSMMTKLGDIHIPVTEFRAIARAVQMQGFFNTCNCKGNLCVF